ncbi:TerC family protein [Marinicrinis lubricantis]|uniref:TerC family protein n=1 Tax=Marinicrinis lubricantis TaxID=2086470 RepID=A0ABW1IUM3_9BACL
MDSVWMFLEILLINMVLSGDNAVVIAMASKHLPEDQRKYAVWWGALGAVIMRLVLTFIAVVLLDIPLIQALGSLLLLYIALKLLTQKEEEREMRSSSNLWAAVWTIIVADFIMSLDNVLAVAAIANGNLTVLIAGITLSIPIIIWGSTFMMKLLDRLPVLNLLGAAILGYTAGEMLVNDEKVQQWLIQAHSSYHWVVPLFSALIVICMGLWVKVKN